MPITMPGCFLNCLKKPTALIPHLKSDFPFRSGRCFVFLYGDVDLISTHSCWKYYPRWQGRVISQTELCSRPKPTGRDDSHEYQRQAGWDDQKTSHTVFRKRARSSW